MQGKLRTIKTTSQCGKILAYLKDGNTLSVAQARELGFGDNLRSRISDLEKAGHKIKKSYPGGNGCNYAVYALEVEDE